MNKAAQKRLTDMAKGQRLCHRRKIARHQDLLHAPPMPALERVWPFGQTVIFEELSWYPPGVYEMVLKARDMLDMQPVPIRTIVPAHWKEPLLDEIERERAGLGFEPMTKQEEEAFLTRFVWQDRLPPFHGPSIPDLISTQTTTDHVPPTLAEGGDHQPELVAHLPIRPPPHQA